MRGNTIRSLLLPLLLAAGLGACASNAVQPGIVYSSGAPSGAYGGGPYGSGPYGPGPSQTGTYNSGGPYGGAQRVSSSCPSQGGYPNFRRTVETIDGRVWELQDRFDLPFVRVGDRLLGQTDCLTLGLRVTEGCDLPPKPEDIIGPIEG